MTTMWLINSDDDREGLLAEWRGEKNGGLIMVKPGVKRKIKTYASGGVCPVMTLSLE